MYIVSIYLLLIILNNINIFIYLLIIYLYLVILLPGGIGGGIFIYNKMDGLWWGLLRMMNPGICSL